MKPNEEVIWKVFREESKTGTYHAAYQRTAERCATTTEVVRLLHMRQAMADGTKNMQQALKTTTTP